MTRHHFDKELEELHHELIRMGSMVEESIENAIYALKKQDIELAKKVLDNDDAIDAQEKKIERICLMLIARQQPLAKDLRVISTALKIITDMERIADHSSDICEITLRMANERYVKPLIDIPLMAEKAKQMVNKAIDAYVKRDVELAKEVCASDDAVDELFSKITFEVTSIMRNNSEAVEQCVDFILIAKYLERMADHATNIGEWVIFSVTGEHMHLN
ncbi:phosphate signaling complex protein PhoU [Clostridium thermosuccinogenes]|uniref:phosphate signaling complex protein PhoU n=1 Tax=Clostridium thermosuccinogenes TaxID=84032 RepID=UPI000CCC1D3C|nr:phosphate signaling complex protein PhoU [Pseudoclostridium thermosuccinogenes]PNT94492.1 phosphate transport system regulatory protein PhoU [Pseudoclostridium thermosuccinogenes]